MKQIFEVPGGHEVKDKKVLSKLTYASWTRYVLHAEVICLDNLVLNSYAHTKQYLTTTMYVCVYICLETVCCISILTLKIYIFR